MGRDGIGNRMISELKSARVLLVDDDPIFVDRATNALEPITDVRTVNSGSGALSVALFWQPDVILLDMLLDDVDGFTFLDQLSEVGLARPPFILFTTDGRGAGTRIRPLPDWKVGTLLRSSSSSELRSAVLQAVRCQTSGLVRGGNC